MVAEILDFEEQGQVVRADKVREIANQIIKNDGVFRAYNRETKEQYEFRLDEEALHIFIMGFCGIINGDDYMHAYLILDELLDKDASEDDFESLKMKLSGVEVDFNKVQATLFCCGVSHAFNYVMHNKIEIEV